MAERVVHVLEVVDVEIEHGEARRAAARAAPLRRLVLVTRLL